MIQKPSWWGWTYLDSSHEVIEFSLNYLRAFIETTCLLDLDIQNSVSGDRGWIYLWDRFALKTRQHPPQNFWRHLKGQRTCSVETSIQKSNAKHPDYWALPLGYIIQLANLTHSNTLEWDSWAILLVDHCLTRQLDSSKDVIPEESIRLKRLDLRTMCLNTTNSLE